jgi:hypothetical protein
MIAIGWRRIPHARSLQPFVGCWRIAHTDNIREMFAVTPVCGLVVAKFRAMLLLFSCCTATCKRGVEMICADADSERHKWPYVRAGCHRTKECGANKTQHATLYRPYSGFQNVPRASASSSVFALSVSARLRVLARTEPVAPSIRWPLSRANKRQVNLLDWL